MFARSLTAVAALALGATPIAALASDSAPFKISGQEAARGAQQISIGAFNVGFVFKSVDQTAATGGLIGAFGGATRADSELVGVTPAMMQSITDAAYADFKTQLAARGYTVVAPEAMFAHPAMAKAKSMAVPLDINLALEKGSKGKATYFKPTELPSLLMMVGDFVGSGMSSMGMTLAAGQSGYAMTQYAKASNVGVVDVVYLIDFSNQKRPGAFSFGGIKVNAGLSVAANYSRLSLVAPSGHAASITIRQPVAVEGDFVEGHDTTSGASKTTQAAMNVAGGVAAVFGMGGMRFGKTRKFEMTAKPGSYEQGATKAATLANEALIGQLVALR